VKACDLCRERGSAFYLYQRDLRREEYTADSCFVCPACLPRFHQEQAMRALERQALEAAAGLAAP
jgi:hypothetical protein